MFGSMSHDLHSTPSILPSISLSSTSPSLTGSRLITSRIHCTGSRGLRGDSFADTQPRTGYEPRRTVDNPIVTEQEIEHTTEESQIQEIEGKGKELIFDPFSLPSNQSLLFRFKILLKALLRLKKQTWTTNKFVLCWLHHGTYRSEKQVRNDHKLITLEERAWCPVHLKVWTSKAQGNLLHCFHIRVIWIKKNFPRENNLLMFQGVMSRFSETLTQQILLSLFLMEIEITCLLKRDPNWWSRNTKWNLWTIVLMSFSNKFMLNDWIWRTPITDTLNLDENKNDYKKNRSWKKQALRETQIRSIHEFGEMKRAQELRVDEFSIQKLRESHETIQRHTSQVQVFQERKNYLNVSGEFHEVESNCSGTCSHVPVNQQGFQVHAPC